MEWIGKDLDHHLWAHASVKRASSKCPHLVFQISLSTIIQLPEYLFIVGGSCFTNTEVVSLSETETTVPNCLSNLADHENEVYNGAGGPLQYEGTGT